MAANTHFLWHFPSRQRLDYWQAKTGKRNPVFGGRARINPRLETNSVPPADNSRVLHGVKFTYWAVNSLFQPVCCVIVLTLESCPLTY